MADATTSTTDATKSDATAQATDDGKGGKQAVLADLAAERDKRQELETKLAKLEESQATQAKALAEAFGVKPEETSDVTRLAAQVQALNAQFEATQRQNLVLTVASEHGITDADTLADLAKVTDEQAMRSLAARLAQSAEARTNTGRLIPDYTQGGRASGGTASTPGQEFAHFLNRQLK